MRVLLVFLDGVGLGSSDAARNPFVAAPPRNLVALLDGALPVAAAVPVRASAATLVALDAALGVPGIPQSGTGQAALLTGRNAASLYGRHFGPWVPAALRAMVREESLLALAVRARLSVTFANAYPEEVRHAAPEDTPAVDSIDHDPENSAKSLGTATKAKHSVLPPDLGAGRSRRAARYLSAGPPLAALGAGVLNRHTPELQRGDAIASEITNEGWRSRLGRKSLPVISAREAGHNLARIAGHHDLTLFAHYATDYAGHQQKMDSAVAALRVVDDFLAGVLAELPEDALLIVASDHGNIEDITTDHTRNPVLGLAAGHRHSETADWSSILDVAPAILRVLGVTA